jgi:hypothetical protein
MQLLLVVVSCVLYCVLAVARIAVGIPVVLVDAVDPGFFDVPATACCPPTSTGFLRLSSPLLLLLSSLQVLALLLWTLLLLASLQLLVWL